jgi:hypothetical protein
MRPPLPATIAMTPRLAETCRFVSSASSRRGTRRQLFSGPSVRRCFVRSYSFRVIEHDPERPWVIVGSGRHWIELEADIDFHEWVREQWPPDRFTVELDPWSLTSR